MEYLRVLSPPLFILRRARVGRLCAGVVVRDGVLSSRAGGRRKVASCASAAMRVRAWRFGSAWALALACGCTGAGSSSVVAGLVVWAGVWSGWASVWLPGSLWSAGGTLARVTGCRTIVRRKVRAAGAVTRRCRCAIAQHLRRSRCATGARGTSQLSARARVALVGWGVHTFEQKQLPAALPGRTYVLVKKIPRGISHTFLRPQPD